MLFPVFSMRREGDLGIGDTTSVRLCLEWLKKHGVGFLQLLPITETGNENSPYSAISSVALDPIYIDMQLIPGLSEYEVNKGRRAMADVRAAKSVQYAQVRCLKLSLLKKAFGYFMLEQDRSEEFEVFCAEEREWLEPYTKFRWLMEEAGGTDDWTQWPDAFNTPEKAAQFEQEQTAAGKDCAGIREFYAWCQWHAFRQWRAVRECADGLGIQLMGDIPIGVSCASSDVFFERQWFDLSWYGGAPPEKVFKDDAFACQWGQNWGIPLYDWETLREHDFGWWRRRVSKLTSVFHIFRIDHILGFYRIFSFPWHPCRNGEFLSLTEEEAKKKTGGLLPQFSPRADDTPEHKAANLADGDEYLRAVIEAADGHEVVGEDLGMVPDYVRPHMAELGIPGFKICHWETNAWGRALDPKYHPECAFATYATHDHPPIRLMWEQLRHNVANGCKGSGDGLKIISQYAGLPETQAAHYSPYCGVIKWALLEALVKSNARYAALMINDILDSTERINTPATVGQHNWSYRVPWDFEAIPHQVEVEMGKFAVYLEKHNRHLKSLYPDTP